MTKRKNMSAGQRQMVLEKKIEQLEMATRISQMLLQQLGESSSQMGRDLGELSTRQRDLQYALLATRQLADVDDDEVAKLSEELQIKDFNEMSQKEDEERGYTTVDTVDEDSVVIITSKADNEKSILRSKIELSELGFPQFREDLLGKKVGDTVEADINGTKHEVTLLGVRKKPEQETAEETEAPEETDEPRQEDGQEVSAQA